jgi:O-antigen ligase
LGFGWDRYTTYSLEYFRQPKDIPMNGYTLGERIGALNPPLPLHDTYLAFAVELGILGALLWLAALLWGIGGAVFARGGPPLRPWKLGLLAVAVFYLVVAVVDPHEQAFPVFLLWAWGGVAFGSASLREQMLVAAARGAPAGTAAMAAAIPGVAAPRPRLAPEG